MADVLARTAIERVAVLDGTAAEPGDLLHADGIHPEWIDDTLTLATSRTTTGLLVATPADRPAEGRLLAAQRTARA